jgi:hypothetical protein
MQLGLVEDDPASGTTAVATEAREQLATERARGLGMRRGWSRIRHQGPVEDLADDVLRQGDEVLVGGARDRSGSHPGTIHSPAAVAV